MQVASARRVVVRILILATVCSAAVDAAAAQQPIPPAGAPQPGQAPASEQSVPPYRARVLGVYDERSGDPIANAKVSDFLSGTSALTTRTGTVTLVFLPDGGSLVRVQKLGYQPQVIPVSISPSDTAPVTLLLHPLAVGSATQLSDVTTTGAAPYLSPALRGFQERMRAKVTGYFIGDSTLRKNESHQLADVMRSQLPNVNLSAGNGRGTALMRSARCVSMSTSPPGPPQVYLDGVPLTAEPPPIPPGARPLATKSVPFDLSAFQVSNLAGVEWYPSTDQAPVEYSHTSDRCGVLLLWTREGNAAGSAR